MRMYESKYWYKNKEQVEFNKLWEKYVPNSGPTKFKETELLRAANGIIYDCYNNGWGCNNYTDSLAYLHNQGFFKKLTNDHLAKGLDILKNEDIELLNQLLKHMDKELDRIVQYVLKVKKENAFTPLKAEDGCKEGKWGLDWKDFDNLINKYHGEEKDEED